MGHVVCVCVLGCGGKFRGATTLSLDDARSLAACWFLLLWRPPSRLGGVEPGGGLLAALVVLTTSCTHQKASRLEVIHREDVGLPIVELPPDRKDGRFPHRDRPVVQRTEQKWLTR